MDTILHDVRYAIRTLSKSRGFTSVALLAIVLAIAASTTIFTLVDSLLLRPLPIYDPGRLASLQLSRRDGQRAQISYTTFQDLATRQNVFSGIFAWDGSDLNDFQVGRVTWHGIRMTVTGDFYKTIGVSLFMGRGISPEDLRAGAPPVAVISYEVWKHRLGGDPAILDKALKVQDTPFTIIGITPPGFFGLNVGFSADVTVPVSTVGLFTLASNENFGWLKVAARPKPGISLPQAQAQLDSIWPALLADSAAHASEEEREMLPAQVNLEPASTGFSSLRPRFSRPLLMLLGMVILVSLLVCANLAALMLARAQARRHEMAVRVALGASTRRILQQLLAETLLLATAGAVVGLLLSFWMSHALASFVWTGSVPLSLNLRPDVRIMAFVISSTLLTGLVFGTVPGWRRWTTRSPPCSAPNRISSPSMTLAGKVVVITQIVISGVLLACAWTVVAHLRQLRTVPLGFDPQRLLLIRLLNHPGAYRNLDHAIYDRELLERVGSAAGVYSASLSQNALFSGTDFTIPVSSSGTDLSSTTALIEGVSPNFFQTLGMQLEEGRDFNWHDDAHSTPVAIVSASLARQLFAHKNPVGESIRIGHQPQGQGYIIVGVSSNARLGNVRNETPTVFLASFQTPEQMLQPLLQVRSVGDLAAVAGSVQNAVESLGREYPLKVEAVQGVIDEQLIPERMIAILSGAFGICAFVLAVISLYGLISYNVTQRTNEIGVRMALGAPDWKVLQLVTRDVCVLLLVGEILTGPLAFVALRLLSSVVAGAYASLSPLIAAGVALAVAAIVAAYVPARKAIRMDPLAALRHE